MEYTPIKEIAAISKKAIKKAYPLYQISVTSDHGWVSARITVPKMAGCACSPQIYGYCKSCRELSSKVHDHAENVAMQAVADAGARFNSFYSDDGYNTQHSCFTLTVIMQPKPTAI